MAALNRARPEADRLELLPSGLLRHHCAHPACPVYLVSLATPRDRAAGTRRGLFGHLQQLMHPARMYVPGFHAAAARLAARSRPPPPRPAFAAALLALLQPRAPPEYAAELAAHVDAVYDQLVALQPP